jgi:hypothetical protein
MRILTGMENKNNHFMLYISAVKALKNIVIFSCAAFIVMNLLSLPAVAVIHGDLNGDGRVDVQDVVKAMRHSLGLEALDDLQSFLADVNSDGKVNVQDVSLVMQKSLGLIEAFSDLPLPENNLIDEFVAGDGITPGSRLVVITLSVPNQNSYRVFAGSTALTFSETLNGFFGEVAEADAVQSKAAVYRK